jgi:YVTN family beta-propeller protein
VLVDLALHAGRVVTMSELVEDLWGGSPPSSAGHTVENYVSRLRRVLYVEGMPGVLVSGGSGYRLNVSPGRVDALCFGELAARGMAAFDRGDATAAAGFLSAALALWRGPALADVQDSAFAPIAARRLESDRLAAFESLTDARLVLGQHREVVSELERAVDVDPYRERFHAQLMVALYRCGRQADALAAFQKARARLADDLGLEPGRELRELERAVLLQASELDPPSPSPPLAVKGLPPAGDVGAAPGPRVGGPGPGSGGRRRRPPVKWAVLVAVAGALTVAATVVATIGPKTAPAVAVDVNVLEAIGASSGDATDRVVLPAQPGAIAVAGGSVWMASPNGAAVLQVGPAQAAVIDRIPSGGEPGSIVNGGSAVFVASTMGATVERIDPGSGTVTWTSQLAETGPVAMAYGDGGLWVADSTDQDLLELGPMSGSVLRTFSLDVHPTSVALAGGLVWVAAYSAGTVEGIDPETGQAVGAVSVGNGPSAICFGGGYLWVANSLDSTVSAVDPATFTVVSTIAVGSGPAALVASQGAIWVANQYSGTVSRISPQRLAVVGSVDVGDNPVALASRPGGVWVAASAAAGDDRGGTVVLVSTSPFGTVDPATYSEMTPLSFQRLAYDTLVTFEPAPGPDGLRLVPDLALQVPAPTDGGRTYSFRLRPGIRYSSGVLVKASDFRHALERLFALGSAGASFYSGLVGAGACEAHPDNCNLSRGVVTNDQSGLVVFHLTAPDPDFLEKLTPEAYAAPVPPGTPDRDMGLTPVPGTGPYRIVRATPREVVFERNPYFREWSHAAQPEGNPDEIVWRILPSQQDVVDQIVQGKADWTWDSVPPAELHAIEVEDPSEVRSNPSFVVEFIPLNTRVAPFNSPLARKALNYAIDRRKIAEMYGGPTVATPTCQPLLPGMLGYQRYCPYTLHPAPDGAWTAPDLALARKLVDESGTKGDVVTVWGSPDEGAVPPQEAAYITQVLRSLGYRARLHMISFPLISQPMWAKFQISVDGDWSPYYPAPSSLLPPFFACNGGLTNGYYCNPAIDREMTEATLLQLQSPAQAAAMWTKVDHQLTDQAEWVATVDLNEVDIISSALRNYEFNPVNGFVADQAVVRG